MHPVATVAEARAADAAALERVDHATLVARAGSGVARGALELLGSAYGRRVVVVAGKGSNGADGRVAARLLERRGARVTVIDAESPGPSLPECALVIDAAYGTGFRGRYEAPDVPDGTRVLAVDIPSGVDGDTGAVSGTPMHADRTLTMAALKPGLLQGHGLRLAGEVEVVDIGVPVGRTGIRLMEDEDVAELLAPRPFGAQKWDSAVTVVAGSPGMEGAAVLATTGASRSGAGMVRLAVPGSGEPGRAGSAAVAWPVEAVRVALPASGWSGDVLAVLDRCRALVVGPGLGRDDDTQAEIRRLIAHCPVPVVVDADALFALGAEPTRMSGSGNGRPVVLTPHDGEYRRMSGDRPGGDRVSAARRLAGRTGAVVLLKGGSTAVASPDGDVLLATAGTPRLATAGTGDVLSGMIGAFIARGVAPFEAAALAAHVHGRAAQSGPTEGLVAGDLPPLVSSWLSEPTGARSRTGSPARHG
ncbi:MAG: NAD(P)H-hydrate dehydratase [Acidimicrobiales bacterium]